jgi:RNA polymerase sigma-70 factor (ECF subfamily)
MEQSAEAELLAKAQAGDSEARDALYTQFFAGNEQVRGLLAREVQQPEDREDIMHDAYLSLIRSKGEFRGDSKLQTFIYRVVQIAILQRLRGDRARRREKMVRLTFEMDGEERERTIPVTDYQFESVEAALAAERMYNFVPEPLRTTFRLRVSEEMSYDEIARRTGAPINTVATRIFKARAILAKLFGAPPEAAQRTPITTKKGRVTGN